MLKKKVSTTNQNQNIPWTIKKKTTTTDNTLEKAAITVM